MLALAVALGAAPFACAYLDGRLNELLQSGEFVRDARAWPYNTSMLRTLVVSLLLPAGAAAAKNLLEGYLP